MTVQQATYRLVLYIARKVHKMSQQIEALQAQVELNTATEALAATALENVSGDLAKVTELTAALAASRELLASKLPPS